MVEIILENFPTHLPYTDNKKKENSYVKLNYQTIYNGKINKFSRAILMNNMHKYIISRLPIDVVSLKFPLKIHLIFNTVVNHGLIQRRFTQGNYKILCPELKEDYSPSWDIENLAAIWRKAINDSLTIFGIIPDDNINYVNTNSHTLNIIKDFNERSISILLLNCDEDLVI